MRIFITGASGFVGRQLVPYLLNNTKAMLCLATRSDSQKLKNARVSYFNFKSLSEDINWQDGIRGCDAVVHLAARVHVMHENAKSPLELYRLINVKATLNLAEQAARAKVKRFIYISSIKVNGENTAKGVKFSPDDNVNPVEPYALSKYEAEQGLLNIAKKTGMEVVIIRPPLVYGPNVKGNFIKIFNLVKTGIPLPLGNIKNKRSLVSVYNLIALINTCLTHKNAANQIFLVSDGFDLSTSELLAKIAESLGRKSRCFALPSFIMQLVTRALGKTGIYQRLWGSLEVDISKTTNLLNWQPKNDIHNVLKELYGRT